MVTFDVLVAPAIRATLGLDPERARTVRARLARNVASVSGREDHVGPR